MSTYFNEITSKPVNTVDGKVLYKIPSGAMCGDGDAVSFETKADKTYILI